MPSVQTRILLLSDTHGQQFPAGNRPLQSVDVIIHCGDLTEGSKLSEFYTTLGLLKDLDAPLKLVIDGNHDFTLDNVAFKQKIAEAVPPLEPGLVAKEYGAFGEARKTLEDAKRAGIVFLDEGHHSFSLSNGALLTVYATPYTPSYGAWGFQYRPEGGREFAIEKGTDIVISHGPPRGVLDMTVSRERAGCPDLFAAVARARPQIHCFGHIHEGWGAKRVAWRPNPSDKPSHFTDIDNEQSSVLETLGSLRPSKFDSPDDVKEKQQKLQRYADARCCKARHHSGEGDISASANYTLFVNASLQGNDGTLMHEPWLVELELTRAGE